MTRFFKHTHNNVIISGFGKRRPDIDMSNNYDLLLHFV